MTASLHIFISLSPIIVFLGVLIILDSFKLITKEIVVLCIAWGMICVIFAYFLNRWLIFGDFLPDFDHIYKLVPPIIEEILKISVIIFLQSKNRIGFMIDATIYGFAVGTGFALIENIYYFYQVEDGNTMLWLVRGFGTAIMHGGTVSIFSILLISALNKNRNILFYAVLGLLIAVSIHYLYNFLSYSARIATLSVILTIPSFLFIIFSISEKSIRKWIDLELDQEVELLIMIRKGHFSDTKAGQYIISLKKHFQPLIMVDILSYIYIYLELSTKAKANMILKENDMPPGKIHDIEEQLNELKALRKNIGKTGMIAIRPILRINNKDLWKLTTLKN